MHLAQAISKNRFYLGLFFGVLIFSGIYAFLTLSQPRYLDFDENLVETIQDLSRWKAYDQKVVTRTAVDSRLLSIEGNYYVDHTQAIYASYATTTLTIPPGSEGAGNHSFSHENLSTGKDIYVRITTNSEFLKPTILDDPDWQHFESNEIPPLYANIAISGPLFDALGIFANQGEFLNLISMQDQTEDEPYKSYTFTIKPDMELYGFLSVIAPRLGADGTIDVLISPDSKIIRRILFKGGNYSSDVEIQLMTEPLLISPPIRSEQ